MDIIIKVTNEQLALIGKFKPTGTFEQEVISYANGLVAFYVDQGRQVESKEGTDLDSKRLETLKAEPELVAQVDAIIEAKVVVVDPIVKPVTIVKGV